MEALEHLSILVALLLAMAAALMSSDVEARQEVIGLFSGTLESQRADLVGDPGYLSGTITEPFSFPLPKREPDPIIRKVDRASSRG
jgi:hypothetical protein